MGKRRKTFTDWCKWFLTEIDLWGDWLVEYLCLFLREVLGYNLDVMERSSGKDFENRLLGLAVVLMGSATMFTIALVSSTFPLCKIRLTHRGSLRIAWENIQEECQVVHMH